MTAQALIGSLIESKRLLVRRGQVLLYPRHTPPGIFVVVGGAVCRYAEGTQPEAGCGDHLDAAEGAFAIPTIEELCGPAPAGVIATRDSEIQFIPRSVALSGAAVLPVLEAAGVAVRALGARRSRS